MSLNVVGVLRVVLLTQHHRHRGGSVGNPLSITWLMRDRFDSAQSNARQVYDLDINSLLGRL